MDGVLLVDKPEGMTSAAVVARVKRVLGVKKVGHTGTLDPMATGVLPLCLGEATKIAGYLLSSEKEYEGTFQLGVETDTLDREGRVVRERRQEAAHIGTTDVQGEMASFRGDIDQLPPMFSAVKVQGRALHKRARAGEVVERVPRRITVHDFELLDFVPGAGTGRVFIRASKGTYVRSLIADLGEALGCGAHLTALRRVRAGSFSIEQCIPLDAVRPDEIVPVPLHEAVAHLPQVLVPAAWMDAVGNGKRLVFNEIFGEDCPQGRFVLVAPGGTGLLAIAECQDSRLRYHRVFNYALTDGP